MKNYDLVCEKLKDLVDLVEASAPCDCEAKDGYIQALHETIIHLETADLGVQTKEGEDAILSDRESLIRDIKARIAAVSGDDDDDGDDGEGGDPMVALASLFESLGFKDVKVMKLN